MRGKLRCPPTLRRLPMLRKVNPCLTGVGNNPLTITKPSRRRRVKDAEGTAKPLVLDSVRWLGYLAAVPVRNFHAQRATIQ